MVATPNPPPIVTAPAYEAMPAALRLYRDQGLNLSADLTNYATWGIALIMPDRLILARPIARADGTRWANPGEPVDTWFVKLAIGPGCIGWFLGQMPYHLPWLAWGRDFRGRGAPGSLKFYPTSRFTAALSPSLPHSFSA